MIRQVRGRAFSLYLDRRLIARLQEVRKLEGDEQTMSGLVSALIQEALQIREFVRAATEGDEELLRPSVTTIRRGKSEFTVQRKNGATEKTK